MIFKAGCETVIAAAYVSKDNSSLEISGLQKDGEGDQLQVHQRQQELIVIATAQADSSAFAGFAHTCEVCSFYTLP